MNGRCKGRSNEGLRMNAICQGRNLKGGEQKEGRQKQRKRLRESDSPSGSESEPVKRRYPTALLANNANYLKADTECGTFGANTWKKPEGLGEPLLRQATHRARGSLLRVEKVSPARTGACRATRGQRLAAVTLEAQPLRQAAQP